MRVSDTIMPFGHGEDATTSSPWCGFERWQTFAARQRQGYVERARALAFGVVAKRHGVTVEDLVAARGKGHPLTRQRNVAIYLMRTVAGCSSEEVGRTLGMRGATVRKHVLRLEDARDDPVLDREFDEYELEMMGATK